jgi:hypothetical protein
LITWQQRFSDGKAGLLVGNMSGFNNIDSKDLKDGLSINELFEKGDGLTYK